MAVELLSGLGPSAFWAAVRRRLARDQAETPLEGCTLLLGAASDFEVGGRHAGGADAVRHRVDVAQRRAEFAFGPGFEREARAAGLLGTVGRRDPAGVAAAFVFDVVCEEIAAWQDVVGACGDADEDA